MSLFYPRRRRKPLLFIAGLIVLYSGVASQPVLPIIDQEDLSFLAGLTRNVFDSSRILPGQIIASKWKNNTGAVIVRPGGRDDYPAFWIRDYAMALETGFSGREEQRALLLLTASTQCDQTWITKQGSMVPFGSIPDHIRIDNRLPIYFPGTYDFEMQGDKVYGMVPPYCDQFFFIHMAHYYVQSFRDSSILGLSINGRKLFDRLEIAFRTPPSRINNQLVYTTRDFRGVDFGFRDAVVFTGDLCFTSILKYRAAGELADLSVLCHEDEKAKLYRQIAGDIRRALPLVFKDKGGLLRASTGLSSQPDVWATALAVYLDILQGDELSKASATLAKAYASGKLAYKGNIRHVLLTDDYSVMSAWQITSVEKNHYQNGAYWGTPTGWVAYTIAKSNRSYARRLVKEYIEELRENDFRKGAGYGAPYECFYPPGYRQNPVYLATVACPYIVLKSILGQ